MRKAAKKHSSRFSISKKNKKIEKCYLLEITCIYSDYYERVTRIDLSNIRFYECFAEINFKESINVYVKNQGRLSGLCSLTNCKAYLNRQYIVGNNETLNHGYNPRIILILSKKVPKQKELQKVLLRFTRLSKIMDFNASMHDFRIKLLNKLVCERESMT